MIEFVIDRQIYEEVVRCRIPAARKFLWLATANLKDLHVDKNGRRVPLLEVLSDLVAKKVEVRLLHGKEPGPVFQADFDRYRNLAVGMEMMLCPRVHLKCVVVDGVFGYTGSANLTGAGMGAKNPQRHNFESGIITTDAGLIGRIMAQFDGIWKGGHCGSCDRKEFCDEHVDILRRASVRRKPSGRK